MAGPPRTVSPSVEFLVSSAAISEAAVPTTVTFVQQVVPTASSLSTAATASSTISYPSGSYASVSIGPGCKVSNLWNWNTIDSCFIGSKWHINSIGAFVGTCIFSTILVLLFFFLRRATEEYDNHILRERYQEHNSINYPPAYEQQIAERGSPIKHRSVRSSILVNQNAGLPLRTRSMTFRPNTLQQGVRATLMLAQFIVGYFILLFVMSWNGWVFLCIGLGVWIGSFVFDWKTVTV